MKTFGIFLVSFLIKIFLHFWQKQFSIDPCVARTSVRRTGHKCRTTWSDSFERVCGAKSCFFVEMFQYFYNGERCHT